MCTSESFFQLLQRKLIFVRRIIFVENLVSLFAEYYHLNTHFLRMAESPSSTSTQRSRRQNLFDPFKLGSNHQDHANSTRIIHLEESNRIFCPLCLKNTTIEELKLIDSNEVYSYLQDWFEALDTYPNNHNLRRVVLHILDTVFSNSTIKVERDNDLHNYMRILNKTVRSFEFDSSEFVTMSKILSAILTSYESRNLMPLTSVWSLTQSMINYAKENFVKIKSGGPLDEKNVKFVTGAATVIQTYLTITKKYSPFGISDMIFPLRESGLISNNSSSDCQSKKQCIYFMEKLIPYMEMFVKSPFVKLSSLYIEMLTKLYEALSECVLVAYKSGNRDLYSELLKLDFIQGAHATIRQNDDALLRISIKNFLRVLVETYFEENFKLDDCLRSIVQSKDNVETNHRNVIEFISSKQHTKRILFYLLINYFGLNVGSVYYSKVRVTRVIKLVDPALLKFDRSVILLKVVSFLISRNFPNKLPDNLENYYPSLWLELDRDKINQVFCTEPYLFFWSSSKAIFKTKINQDSIIVFLNSILTSKDLGRLLNSLMQDMDMKKLLKEYLMENSKAPSLVEHLVNHFQSTVEVGEISYRNEILTDISTILIDGIYDKIFQFGRVRSQEITVKYTEIVQMVLNMIKHNYFQDAVIDECLFKETFGTIRSLYLESMNEPTCVILSNFNELITAFIEGNSTILDNMITSIQATILSLLYNHLSTYESGDKLSCSVARLVVTLDNLNHPALSSLDKVVFPDEVSFINWMLSSDKYLHELALKLSNKMFSNCNVRPLKVSMASALIHMIALDSELIEKSNNFEVFQSLIQKAELALNPLFDVMLDVIPRHLKVEIEIASKLSDGGNRPPSPAGSFASLESSYFNQDNLTVERILRQLHEEDRSDLNDNTCRIPRNIYASQVIRDQHTNNTFDSVDEWEALAEGVINANNPTQS